MASNNKGLRIILNVQILSQMRKRSINYLLQNKTSALSKMQQIMVYQTSLYDLKFDICLFVISL